MYISIIVPIYNSEKYLDRCISSIINQTYPNYELILVNDGSTDSSLAICEKWKSIDKRIRIINQCNSGTSTSRQRGTECARGEYIAFIDSDDYIDYYYLERLVGKAVLTSADMVCCNHFEVRDSVENRINDMNDCSITSRNEMMNDFFVMKGYLCVAWGKIIRRELLQSRGSFPKITYGEDVYMLFSIITNCNRVELLEYAGYYYFRHSNSLMGDINKEKSILDSLTVASFIDNRCKKDAIEYVNYSQKRMLDYIYGAIAYYMCNKSREDIIAFRHDIDNYINQLDFSGEKSLKLLIVWLFYKNVFFYRYLIKLLYKLREAI